MFWLYIYSYLILCNLINTTGMTFLNVLFPLQIPNRTMLVPSRATVPFMGVKAATAWMKQSVQLCIFNLLFSWFSLWWYVLCMNLHWSWECSLKHGNYSKELLLLFWREMMKIYCHMSVTPYSLVKIYESIRMDCGSIFWGNKKLCIMKTTDQTPPTCLWLVRLVRGLP